VHDCFCHKPSQSSERLCSRTSSAPSLRHTFESKREGSGRRGSSLERKAIESYNTGPKEIFARRQSRSFAGGSAGLSSWNGSRKEYHSAKSMPAVERGLTEDVLPYGFAVQQQENRRGCDDTASSIRYSLVKGNDPGGSSEKS